jgi:hypothetical protein
LGKLSLLLPIKITDWRMGRRFFYAILLALCVAYFGVETYFITHNIFSADDFWLAYHTYHYKTGLPYKDFSPYKTVLGYYLMLLPMLVTQGSIAGLFAIKILLAAVNTFCLAVAGCSLLSPRWQWWYRLFSSWFARVKSALIC